MSDRIIKTNTPSCFVNNILVFKLKIDWVQFVIECNITETLANSE